MNSSILQTYKERLPWHGHATDDPKTGVRLYPTQELLKKSIVQSNPYNSIGLEYRDWETDRKSTRLNSSHSAKSRMPSSA